MAVQVINCRGIRRKLSCVPYDSVLFYALTRGGIRLIARVLRPDRLFLDVVRGIMTMNYDGNLKTASKRP